ncbi:MAG: hypothetical protein JNK17_02215 [Hydrogenophaga sp.]|nr:hypothetical protein [Hydrogenophaga sp.]
MGTQATVQQMELLADTVAPLPLDVMKEMRRVWDRRWRHWHWCLRFEDACADPVTFRLLRLSTKGGRALRPTPDE